MVKVELKWRKFDQAIEDIRHHYQSKSIKMIIGISRGGLVPAVSLSHKLSIPMDSLVWQTRDGIHKDVSKLMRLQKLYKPEEILFVDDICDSGRTIREIREHFPNASFTTLIDKIPEEGLVEYAPLRFGDEWIIFPWE